MKILLLGASGYLGKSLYSKLKMTAYEVIGTSYQKQHQELIRIDIINPSDLFEMVKLRPDVIIWSLMSGNDEIKLTELGLAPLLKNIPPTTKLIYISSDSVFANGEGNYKEDDPTSYLSDVNPLHQYANAKKDAEKMVIKHYNHLIIRTGPIYGQNTDGKWDNRIANLKEQLSNGKRLKRTDNLYKTFVHIDDLVASIIEMIEKDIKGIIHAGPMQKESYYSFNLKIANKLNLDYSLIDSEQLTLEEANSKGIPLDTSLNTEKISNMIKTSFRNV